MRRKSFAKRKKNSRPIELGYCREPFYQPLNLEALESRLALAIEVVSFNVGTGQIELRGDLEDDTLILSTTADGLLAHNLQSVGVGEFDSPTDFDPSEDIQPFPADGSTSVDIGLGEGDDRLTISDSANGQLGGTVVDFSGGEGNDTFVGPNVDNGWEITGLSAGMLRTFSWVAESVIGGVADDEFTVQPGGEIAGDLNGGSGTDLIDFSPWTTAISVDLNMGTSTAIGRSISGIENVTGGASDDSITGSSDPNVIFGGNGNDSIDGGAGADILSGDAGEDQIQGGPDDDRVDGGLGSDTLMGDEGNDELSGGSGDDIVTGGQGNDMLSDGDGTDFLSGGEGDDYYRWTLDEEAAPDGILFEDESGRDTFDFSNAIGELDADWSSDALSVKNAGGGRLEAAVTGDQNRIENLIGSDSEDDSLVIDAGGNDTLPINFTSWENVKIRNATIVLEGNEMDNQLVVTGNGGTGGFYKLDDLRPVEFEFSSLTFLGGDGNDELIIRENALLDEVVGEGLPQFSQAASGGHANDSFTHDTQLDETNVGLHFDGGNEDSEPGDRVSVEFVMQHDLAYYSDDIAVPNSGVVYVPQANSDDIAISFEDVEPLSVIGMGGTLTVDATSTPAAGNFTVEGAGAGSNIVRGDGGFEDTTFEGFVRLEFRGGTGEENITIRDLEASSPVSGGDALTELFVTGDNTFGDDAAPDVIRLENLPVSISAELLGGLGNDIIVLGDGSLDGLLGMIAVDGEGNDPTSAETVVEAKDGSVAIELVTGDTLALIDDSALYEINEMSITSSLSFSQMNFERFDLTSTSAATINVNSTPANSFFSITTSGESDFVTITETGELSVLQVSTLGGGDTVTLDHSGMTDEQRIVIVDTGSEVDIVNLMRTHANSGVQVDGGTGDDIFTVMSTGSSSVTRLSGQEGADEFTVIETGEESRLQIDGGTGGDAINVEGTGALSQGQLNGQDGNDTFVIGNGSLDGMEGPIMIDGGDEASTPVHPPEGVIAKMEPREVELQIGDTLEIKDEADTSSNTYDLAETTFGRPGTELVMFDEIETIVLDTSIAGSTVNVNGTPASSHTSITSQGADDTIRVGSTGSNSVLLVSTNGGQDTVSINDTGGAAPDTKIIKVESGAELDTITITGTSVNSGVQVDGGTGDDIITVISSGSASVTRLNGQEGADEFTVTETGDGSRLQIDGGTGGDLINVEGTGALSQSQLNGQDGNDTFMLGSGSLDGLEGPTMIDGGNEAPTPVHPPEGVIAKMVPREVELLRVGDTLEFKDEADTSNNTYDLAETTLGRPGTELVMFDEIETIVLNTSIAGSTVNVNGTPASSHTSITSQGADDTIRVGSTGSNSVLLVSTNGGQDTVSINDTGGAAPDTRIIKVETGAELDNITITSTSINSGLQVDGGAGGDVLMVEATGDLSVTRLNGETGSDTITVRNSGANSAVQVDGGSGDDTIITEQTGSGSQSQLNGNADNDTIILGNGTLAGLLGQVMVDGGGQRAGGSSSTVTSKGITVEVTPETGDMLIVQDEASLDSGYEFTASNATINGIQVMFTNIEVFLLNASNNTNSTVIESTPASSALTLNFQDGIDEVEIDGVGVNSSLTVNSNGGDDVITVNTGPAAAAGVVIVNAGDGSDTVDVVSTSDGSGLAISTANGNDNVTVFTTGANSATTIEMGGGRDVVAVQGTGAGSGTDVTTGAGDDLVLVSSDASTDDSFLGSSGTLDNLLGDLCINGGDQSSLDSIRREVVANATKADKTVTASVVLPLGDQLFISDASNLNGGNYTLTETEFSRDTGLISQVGVEEVAIELGDGDDSLTVQSSSNIVAIDMGEGESDVEIVTTGARSILEIESGAASDEFDLQMTGNGSFLQIVAGGGSDRINQDVSGGTTGDGSGLILQTGIGADAVVIHGTGSDSATSIVTDQGNDIVAIRATGGDGEDVFMAADDRPSAVDVLLGAGNDEVVISSDALADGSQPSGTLDGIAGNICIDGQSQTGSPIDQSVIVKQGDIEKEVAIATTVESGDRVKISDIGNTDNTASNSIGADLWMRDGLGMIGYVNVEELAIETGANADEIRIQPFAGYLELNSGDGNDLVTVEATSPDGIMQLFTGEGSDEIIVEGTGAGSIALIDSGDQSDTITVETTGNESGVSVNAGSADDELNLQLTGSDSATRLIGEQGNDQFTILGIGGDGDDSRLSTDDVIPAAVDLEGGVGNDRFEVGNSSRSLQDIDGNLCVAGDDNDLTDDSTVTIKSDSNSLTVGDILTFNDEGDVGSFNYALSNNDFRRSNQTSSDDAMDGSVDFVAIETIHLLAAMGTGNTGGSAVVVSDTEAGVNLRIKTQESDDTIVLQDSGTDSNVLLETDGGSDQITINNTGSMGSPSLGSSSAGSFVVADAGEGDDVINLVANGANSRIELNGASGADMINVASTAVGSVTSIVGGSSTELDGSDAITIGSNGRLEAIDGDICVAGGNHDSQPEKSLVVKDDVNTLVVGDLVFLDDSAEIADRSYVFSENGFSSGPGMEGSIEFSTDIESIQFDATQGEAIVRIDDAPATVNLTVNLQASNDTVTVNATGDDSSVELNTSAGSDTITINGLGNIGVPDIGTADAGSFLVANAGSGDDVLVLVGTSINSRINLNGQEGNDSIFVESAATDSRVEVRGNEGNDNVTLGRVVSSIVGEGRNLSGIDGEVCLHGDAGEDMLTADDSADPASLAYKITEEQIQRFGVDSSGDEMEGKVTMATSGLTTFEIVELLTSEGATTVEVCDTPREAEVRIITQDADDEVVVNGTGDSMTLVINLNGGADSILVEDTGDSSIVRLNSADGNDNIWITGTGNLAMLDANLGLGEDNVLITGTGDLATLAIDTEAGTDTVSITASGRDSLINTSTGPENDTINLGASGGGPDLIDEILGGIFIDGQGNGSGTVNVLDDPFVRNSVTNQPLQLDRDPFNMQTIFEPGDRSPVGRGDTLNVLDMNNTTSATYTLETSMSEFLSTSSSVHAIERNTATRFEYLNIEEVVIKTGVAQDQISVKLPDAGAPAFPNRMLFDGNTPSGADSLPIPESATDSLMIEGTDLDDSITVGEMPDGLRDERTQFSQFEVNEIECLHLFGYEGNDIIHNDTDVPSRIVGDNGRDVLVGGSNRDLIFGGNDADAIYGRDGSDFLFADEIAEIDDTTVRIIVDDGDLVAGNQGQGNDTGSHDVGIAIAGSSVQDTIKEVEEAFETNAQKDVITWLSARFPEVDLTPDGQDRFLSESLRVVLERANQAFNELGCSVSEPGSFAAGGGGQSYDLPTDVNRDGIVSPIDALLVINILNEVEISEQIFADVDNNGIVSPLDALLVINDLDTTLPDSGQKGAIPVVTVIHSNSQSKNENNDEESNQNEGILDVIIVED